MPLRDALCVVIPLLDKKAVIVYVRFVTIMLMVQIGQETHVSTHLTVKVDVQMTYVSQDVNMGLIVKHRDIQDIFSE